MKAVILAGGLGTRLSEETVTRPKPMVEIGGRPILWHICKIYAAGNITDFVICLGYKGYIIKEYFANYALHMSNISINLRNEEVIVHRNDAEDWRITLIDTGEQTMTGGRLKRALPYIDDGDIFCATYGDGVSDVNVAALIEYHKSHGKIATVTAVPPPGRFGQLEMSGDVVAGFHEKVEGKQSLINGGFFVLSKEIEHYIGDDNSVWEREPMQSLATDGELMAYRHTGFWQPMDTLRDKILLDDLWSLGESPMENLVITPAFWRDRQVLVTGHTGFKGSWLAFWLTELGARVSGYALAPNTEPSLFKLLQLGSLTQSTLADINDRAALNRHLKKTSPQIVFHLAAQPLVRQSYETPVETFATNVLGTANLLDAVRQLSSVRAVVVVTSDKCYENREWAWSYREVERMGGHDPYSASKGCAELVSAAMRRSFFTSGVANAHPARVATARAGNVIGGGDWSADRLVPDIIRGCLGPKGVINLRNPNAVRPWQHVLDPIGGYIQLAERLFDGAPGCDEAWNFGPMPGEERKVIEVSNAIVAEFGVGRILIDSDPAAVHEANVLRLDIAKAQQKLGWKPVLNFEQAIAMTTSWYSAWNRGLDIQSITRNQIAEYAALMNGVGKVRSTERSAAQTGKLA